MKKEMGKVRRSDAGLAVDIPTDLAERLGIKEGDDVHVLDGPGGSLRIVPDLSISHAVKDSEERARLLRELRKNRGSIPVDFKFNRDEANER